MKLILPAARIAVKICGLTDRDDALSAIDAGADLLGFNTWPNSKRFIDIERCAGWIAALPQHVCKVALLVNASESDALRVARLPYVDALQFHGDEDAAYCKRVAGFGKPIIKAIRARDAGSLVDAGSFGTENILIDACVPGEFGGTGTRVDLEIARQFKIQNPRLTLWLAGGLTPENVAGAVSAVAPAVVDVSSGVERSPGRKDPALVRAFVRAAKGM